MACYVGLIATIPFFPIAQAVAYERTFIGAQGTISPGDIMPPPPYIPPPPNEQE